MTIITLSLLGPDGKGPTLQAMLTELDDTWYSSRDWKVRRHKGDAMTAFVSLLDCMASRLLRNNQGANTWRLHLRTPSTVCQGLQTFEPNQGRKVAQRLALDLLFG